MPVCHRRWEWFLSFALIGSILIALLVALLLQDPMSTANVP
jgi:hypothetical protein